MKALMVMLVFAAAVVSTPSFAAIKCVPTPNGGMCCWDTERDGPFRPLGC
jgi:hypothetical protein